MGYPLSKLDVAVLLAVVLVGLIHLAFPYHGDQAFFTVGAIEMSHDKALYRDFWDLKQPGIFYFYFLAGKLFGFNEIGIHTFELLYMIAFSIVLQLTLKPEFKSPIFASFIPLLTVVIYYSATGYWHLTQLEALVGFPIFLTLLFAVKAPDSQGKWSLIKVFISGMMGGIVLLFKLIFLLILIPFWLAALIQFLLLRRQKIYRDFALFILALAAGLSLPLGIFLINSAQQNALPIIYQTFFVYPPRILAELPPVEIERLQDGLRWFFRYFIALIFFALIGAYSAFRQSKSLLNLCLVLWCFSGIVTILIQRQSWWQYHYLLLFVPLGILTAIALEFIWQKTQLSSRRYIRLVTVGILVLLLAYNFNHLRSKILTFTKNGFALSKEQQFAYQQAINNQYRDIREDTTFLSQPGNIAGDIYIAGNPLFYFISGRQQATRLNGWSLELFLPEQWKQLVAEITLHKPVYILVDLSSAQLISTHAPELQSILKKSYKLFRKSNLGTWYILQ